MKKICFLLILFIVIYGCDFSTNEEDYEKRKQQRLIEKFSCKVDGKLWVAYESDGIFSLYPFPIIMFDRDKLEFYAVGEDRNQNQLIEFKCDTIRNSSGKNSISRGHIQIADTSHPITSGEIIIDDDTTNNVLRCRFNFTAKQKNTGAEIHITDGQIKIEYSN